MRLFGRARAAEPAAAVQTVPGGRGGAFSGALDRYQAAGMERKLYDTLRLTVPIIDAAVCKIVRLTGGVSVQCESRRAREDLNRFLESVQVNACGTGIETFLGIYLEQLLTYGTALGEIVVSQDGKEISGLYNASLDDVELRTGDSPLELKIYSRDGAGNWLLVQRPELIAVSTLSPRPGELLGAALCRLRDFEDLQQHGPELGTGRKRPVRRYLPARRRKRARLYQGTGDTDRPGVA